MTTHLTETKDPHASKYWSQLETALMAQAIDATSDLPDERRKALRKVWLIGTFDFAAAGLEKDYEGTGLLEWMQEGRDTFSLFYHAPYGLICPLAKIYRQQNNTWAAMIVAGVRDEREQAMAAAEWGISRLTA